MLTGKTLKELQTSSLALNTGTTITDEYSFSISVPMFSPICPDVILRYAGTFYHTTKIYLAPPRWPPLKKIQI